MVDGPMLPYPVEDLQTLLGRALTFLVSMWLPEFLYRMSGFHGSHGFHGFYGFYVVSRVSIPHLRFPWFPWFSMVSMVSMLSIVFIGLMVSMVSMQLPWFLYRIFGFHRFSMVSIPHLNAEHRVQESST